MIPRCKVLKPELSDAIPWEFKEDPTPRCHVSPEGKPKFLLLRIINHHDAFMTPYFLIFLGGFTWYCRGPLRFP